MPSIPSTLARIMLGMGCILAKEGLKSMICDKCIYQRYSLDDSDLYCIKGHWEGGYYDAQNDDDYDPWEGCKDYKELGVRT